MKIAVLLGWMSLTLGAVAQPFERVEAPFPVEGADGRGYAHPFFGGFNTPRMQFVDHDADGDLDLFVQEHSGQLMLFRNDGTAERPEFNWTTDRYSDLSIGEWFRFVDADGDGDPDLFAEEELNLVRYYRNEGSPGTPQFTLVEDTLRDTDGQPVFADRLSIPAFADPDCDGDSDLFLGEPLAGSLIFYRHVGLDAEGLPRFTFETSAYQNIFFVSKRASPENPLHGANALEFADLDGDADLDLFIGDLFSPSLYHFAETGTCTVPELDFITNRYPDSRPVETRGYNIPRFADLDGDADLDLFVGVLGGGALAPVENFWFYRNTGSVERAAFERETTCFIDGLDVGAHATPTLADLDGDGDLDLVLGRDADPDGGGEPGLVLVRNIGTPEGPEFRVEDEDVASVDIPNGFNLAPAFADLDGDADLDLVVGSFNGTVHRIENIGSVQNPVFDETAQSIQVMVEGTVVNLKAGNNSVPMLSDLDGDLDLDLIVGENSGRLSLYRNEGTASSPAFVLEDRNFAGIDVGANSAPALSDLDGDGGLDLFVGSQDQGITVFVNDGGTFSESITIGADGPKRLAPAVGDLDGDGDPDMIAGTESGGVVYWQNAQTATSVKEELPPVSSRLDLYPNPFREFVMISVGGAQQAEFTVFDMLGRKVRAWRAVHRVRWDGRDASGRRVAPGVYVVVAKVGDRRVVQFAVFD